MARKLPTFLPRVAALVLVALAATAGLTFAAGGQVASAPPVPTVDTAPTPPLIVPEVRNLAFVFAKGTLADAGFAWRVVGPVDGFAANIVVGQSPAAGTRVVDTGAPLITLTLKRNRSYKQVGEASNKSPYPGTVVQQADLAGNALGPAAPAAETPTTPAKTATTPAATATTPAATTPATTATTPATTPAKTAKSATPATKPAGATTAKSTPAAWPQTRPVAFVDPGAKKEPLDEMPLPDRAKALGTWLDTHQTKSAKDAAYWLYQNEWVVAGAQMGWWHGADALQTLIAVDRRTQSLWGIGAKSA
ncbi:MAG TPA: PASTA domain-containing protein, partial [Gaiellaceae bacterium]|nr:PASTA domain-containing protein [Gaiellaceae bacterium]